MRLPSPVCALATMTLLCGPAWGGPAHSSTDPAVPDTLNIEFHWLDRDPTPEERAVMERAGKSWSRRIRAYPDADRPSLRGPLTLTQAGYYLREGHRTRGAVSSVSSVDRVRDLCAFRRHRGITGSTGFDSLAAYRYAERVTKPQPLDRVAETVTSKTCGYCDARQPGHIDPGVVHHLTGRVPDATHQVAELLAKP